MSLVVAEATEDGPRIVSDTRITLPHDARPSFKTGGLKAIVLSPHLAVCFAGDVVAAIDAIREIASNARCSTNDIVQLLERYTTSESRIVEFILATSDPEMQITRILGGVAERNCSSAWIGDKEAFEFFQEARHTSKDFYESLNVNASPSQRVMSRLQDAMGSVIKNPAVKTVDDFCVSVAHKPNGFVYLESMFIQTGRDFEIKPGSDLVSMMAQPVSEGGYAVSVIAPSDPGIPALGLSFPRARLGMVYLPLKYDEAQVISDISPNDFARAVENKFGVRLNESGLRYADKNSMAASGPPTVVEITIPLHSGKSVLDEKTKETSADTAPEGD